MRKICAVVLPLVWVLPALHGAAFAQDATAPTAPLVEAREEGKPAVAGNDAAHKAPAELKQEDVPGKEAEDAGKKEKPKPWTEIVKLIGDLRLRHETVAAQDRPEQNRMRFRARAGLSAKIVPWLEAALQLASGTADPISTNQTFSGAFGSKPVQIDLAYLDLKTEGMSGLRVVAGKMPNPFVAPGKTQLIFDGDLTPEGAAASFTAKASEALEFSATAGGFWVMERSTAEDTWMIGLQAVFKAQASGGKAWAKAGVSLFHYENMKGFAPLYDASKGCGNSTYTVGTAKFYSNEFELFEAFLEAGLKIGGFSGSCFFDFVVNRMVDDDGAGFSLGMSLKAPHGIGASFSWRSIEKDAVIGAFTDSDFAGGTTDAFGLVCCAEWEAVKNVKFSLTYFENTTPIEMGKHYRRFQADVSVKF